MDNNELTLQEKAFVQAQVDVLKKVYKVNTLVKLAVSKKEVILIARIPLVPPRGKKKFEDRNFILKFDSNHSAGLCVKILQENFLCQKKNKNK